MITVEINRNAIKANGWLIHMGVECERMKSEWIPCSERLPEEQKLVLITRSNGEVCIIRWNTWWYKQTKYPTIKPIAWMPLPEPYKEVEE